ncbi:MAG TPA: hypothetical protein VI757_13095 [Bacteroidia bacterium]|nr:hypothetical protein [Bacteroidia bacterium]
MKLKYIYWFSFYNPFHPTVRYRGKYPLEFLRNNYGVNSSFIYPDYNLSNIFMFFRVYFSVLLFRRRNSLIVIQSVHSNFIYGKALRILVRLRRKHTIYDIDDADYVRYPPSTIYYFIKSCSALIVGSRELLKNLSRLNSNAKLITCPVPDLQIVKKKKNNRLTIGWIG